MLRKFLFLLSLVFIGNFGYQLFELSREPLFSPVVKYNNIFLIVSMLFFSFVVFYIKNENVKRILGNYYHSFNLKGISSRSYSFEFLFGWLFFSYFHYQLLTFAGACIFPIIYSFPMFMDNLTINLVYNIDFFYGWVVRAVLLYPLPFIVFNILKNDKQKD